MSSETQWAVVRWSCTNRFPKVEFSVVLFTLWSTSNFYNPRKTDNVSGMLLSFSTCHFLVDVSVSTITGSSCTFENSICNSLFKSQSAEKHLQHRYHNESFWETVNETQLTSSTAWKPIFLTELHLGKQISFFLLYCICFAGCQEKQRIALWLSQNSFRWLDIWLAYSSLRLVFISLASYSSSFLSLGERDNYCYSHMWSEFSPGPVSQASSC